jgi:hypothetical protein
MPGRRENSCAPEGSEIRRPDNSYCSAPGKQSPPGDLPEQRTEEWTLFDPTTAIGQALEALEANRLEEAVVTLRAHLHRDAGDALAHALLGAALRQMGDGSAATEAFGRARALRPDLHRVCYDRGKKLEKSGKLMAARVLFAASLELDAPSRPLGLAALPAVAASAPPTAAARPAPSPGERAEAAPARPPRHEALLAPPLPTRERSALPAPAPTPAGPAGAGRRANWGGETRPGLFGLGRAVLSIWGQEFLLWFAALALPNAVAALAAPRDPSLRWLAVLIWIAALGVGTGPVLLGMAGQWMYGQPFPYQWKLTPARWLRATALTLPYTLLVLGPLCSSLAYRFPFSIEGLLFGGLMLSAPFHALLAPGLVLSATDGPGGWRSIDTSLRLAGRRSWTHLGLILGLCGLAGGTLFAIGWGLGVTLQGTGGGVRLVMEMTGLCVGESLWAALMVLCGADALAGGTAREAETATQWHS